MTRGALPQDPSAPPPHPRYIFFPSWTSGSASGSTLNDIGLGLLRNCPARPACLLQPEVSSVLQLRCTSRVSNPGVKLVLIRWYIWRTWGWPTCMCMLSGKPVAVTKVRCWYQNATCGRWKLEIDDLWNGSNGAAIWCRKCVFDDILHESIWGNFPPLQRMSNWVG